MDKLAKYLFKIGFLMSLTKYAGKKEEYALTAAQMEEARHVPVRPTSPLAEKKPLTAAQMKDLLHSAKSDKKVDLEKPVATVSKSFKLTPEQHMQQLGKMTEKEFLKSLPKIKRKKPIELSYIKRKLRSE